MLPSDFIEKGDVLVAEVKPVLEGESDEVYPPVPKVWAVIMRPMLVGVVMLDYRFWVLDLLDGGTEKITDKFDEDTIVLDIENLKILGILIDAKRKRAYVYDTLMERAPFLTSPLTRETGREHAEEAYDLVRLNTFRLFEATGQIYLSRPGKEGGLSYPVIYITRDAGKGSAWISEPKIYKVDVREASFDELGSWTDMTYQDGKLHAKLRIREWKYGKHILKTYMMRVTAQLDTDDARWMIKTDFFYVNPERDFLFVRGGRVFAKAVLL